MWAIVTDFAQHVREHATLAPLESTVEISRHASACQHRNVQLLGKSS
jgi:hypothetical protein